MELQALAVQLADGNKPAPCRFIGHRAVLAANVSAAPRAFPAGKAAPEAELRDHPWQPRRVILFSGHRVDEPGRATPRFPLDKVPIAAAAIGQALQRIDAGPDDLALTQGASGGDRRSVPEPRRPALVSSAFPGSRIHSKIRHAFFR